MEDPFKRPVFVPAVSYRDPAQGLAFLERAFGFRPVMVIRDPQGAVVHAEMRFGEALLYVGSEWGEVSVSPLSVEGHNTQAVHVRLDADLDRHCAAARQAGAVIVQEPTDQFYGDRTYRARDPEGHVWTFGQFSKFISRKDAEQATGLSIEAPDWA